MTDKCGKKECCGFLIMLLVLVAVLVLTISVNSREKNDENSPVNADVYVGLAILGVFVLIAVICLCVAMIKQGKTALPKTNVNFLEKIKPVLKLFKGTSKDTDIIYQPFLIKIPENTVLDLNKISKDNHINNMDQNVTKTKDGNK